MRTCQIVVSTHSVLGRLYRYSLGGWQALRSIQIAVYFPLPVSFQEFRAAESAGGRLAA